MHLMKVAALTLAVVVTLAVATNQASAAQGALGISLNDQEDGAYVAGVEAGSLAAEVGIEVGWRLSNVNGQATYSVSAVQAALAEAPNRAPITFIFETPDGELVQRYAKFSGTPGRPVNWMIVP